MQNLLKKHFGHDQFKLLQKDIIDAVLAQKDCLVLMPTGGGKSLCFQLPALMLDGVTLVISPLIALMKDQIDALKANGIAAEFINSSLSWNEIQAIQNKVKQGQVKILYLAPERLVLPGFLNFLSSIKLGLIAIDEAHCISEWGHDFRPDYRHLKILRQQFPQVPVIALTATATEKVRQDIVGQLNLKNAQTYISSFNRPNLSYFIQPKAGAFDSLIQLLKKHKNKPTIIYCFSRKDTEELAEDLRYEGFEALHYHAGMENEERKQAQEKFIRDKVPIITATIAFGMGIDKPDIRLVVHYNLPKTVESYYQQTGRAGRDGLPSECVLFYSYADKIKQDFFINKIEDEAEKKKAMVKLEEIVNFCELTTCRRAFLLNYFGEEQEEDNCESCDCCLAPKDEFEATEITQKVISAVLRTGERFGVNHIISVLRGSRNAKIRGCGHHELSVFNIVHDFSNNELKDIIKSLIGRKLLRKNQGEYPTLGVTYYGRQFLQDDSKISLPKPDIKLELAEIETKQDINYDQDLFEILRVSRQQIADQRGVPPFIIFSDLSLQQMAYYFPQSQEGFARISGVGQEKLKQFGNIFIEQIQAYAKSKSLSEKEIPLKRNQRQKKVKERGSTYDRTKRLVEQKLTLAEIAKERGIIEQTVIGHIEKLAAAGEELDLDYLNNFDSARFEKIKQAFKKTNSSALSPARELLGEDFSYDELRLGRLFLKSG